VFFHAEFAVFLFLLFFFLFFESLKIFFVLLEFGLNFALEFFLVFVNLLDFGDFFCSEFGLECGRFRDMG
jgi:hypothetical protein